jgi:hypothetical protein
MGTMWDLRFLLAPAEFDMLRWSVGKNLFRQCRAGARAIAAEGAVISLAWARAGARAKAAEGAVISLTRARAEAATK